MASKATRASWQNIPIDDPKRIDISLRFTDDQFSSLTKGLIPEEMEDKWFIFYEDGWLYFHRSWTGFGIYKAQLIKETDGYSINEFQAERNREKYSCNDDNHDTDDISFLIARGLLGIDVRNIYADKKMESDTDILKSWSSFGSLLFSNQGIHYTDKVKSVLFGVAVGDTLGVPVEFAERNILKKNPVTHMTGYGTYNQPPGTFSDDSSLTFCLAEALTEGFDLDAIGRNFVRWYRENYWTARGDVFDIGNATRQAIKRLEKGVLPDLAGGTEGSSNGNGSLMRILPLLFYLLDKPVSARFEMTKLVSSLTHRHIRSVIACFYYLEFALKLLAQKDKFEIYRELQEEIISHLHSLEINSKDVSVFDRLLKGNINELPEEKIESGGYVIHTLEAGIWCLLTTNNYREAVLKAVNLGGDTDTTAAVTGGLAGLLYGYENIPAKWIDQLARRNDIENLAERLAEKTAG